VTIKVHEPSKAASDNAWIKSLDQYHKIYAESVSDPDKFWAGIADRISWYKKWDKVRDFDFVNANIKFYEGAKLNVSYNCLDRHIESGHGDQIALIWEGNNPSEDKKYTYQELLNEVSKFANVLKANGIEKGDRVCIYMQMIPELAVAMLACARIGAVHSIVFGAFSSDSLRD
jgi:acetyl-CoA synthetase